MQNFQTLTVQTSAIYTVYISVLALKFMRFKVFTKIHEIAALIHTGNQLLPTFVLYMEINIHYFNFFYASFIRTKNFFFTAIAFM